VSTERLLVNVNIAMSNYRDAKGSLAVATEALNVANEALEVREEEELNAVSSDLHEVAEAETQI
jgi:predicted regulator of Ras-like GTPase activity (Roadblock/LC7/MglB family)